MQFFAHSKQNKDGNPASKDEWEPLSTPFGGDPQAQCQGNNGDRCPKCEKLEPDHGHLNKVAHLAARFAGEMFPEGEDRESARQWGYLAGLWHDLGKFAPEWQAYLATKADPHTAEAPGNISLLLHISIRAPAWGRLQSSMKPSNYASAIA
jgi:hypothetical protein